jgi:ketosteroid isomerase-like protein
LDLRRGEYEVKPSPAGTTQAKTNQHRPSEARLSVTAAPENPAEDREVSEARLAILAWAQAWSRRDVVSYLGAYTSDYAGNDAPSKRQAWIELRRSRILARKNISVELSALALIREGNLIIATFDQRYTSDGPASHVHKQMHLVSINGQWRIQSETTLP